MDTIHADTTRDGPAIEARGLHKRYGDKHALHGLDLTVTAGTVCGLLGPNGAGKTTAVRVFATLAAPDSGRARVAGYDVVREADLVRRSIGLASQHAAVDEGITGRENLRLVGRLHHLGRRGARLRADELLESYGLAGAADRLVRTYSGGMRRRLDLIATLVTRPAVLFLDEPTTGLDPHSRNDIWRAIRGLAAQATTVLLTTQYLDEADRLADAITVVDEGRAIAWGSSDELKAAVGTRIEVTLDATAATEEDSGQPAAAAEVLRRLAGGEPALAVAEGRISVLTKPGRTLTLPRITRELDAAGVSARDVALRRPSLDDVFLTLTGRGRTTVTGENTAENATDENTAENTTDENTTDENTTDENTTDENTADGNTAKEEVR